MKVRTVAAAVLVVALGYPATSWFLGQQVNSTLETQYQKLTDNPFIQLRERKVETGVFESVETATFELMPAFFQAMNKAQQGNSAAPAGEGGESAVPQVNPAPMEPLRFTTRSVIKHGPFPGLAGFGAANAHTELVLDNPRNPILTMLYGDKAPLTIDTAFGFGGGGHQVALSPAVDSTVDGQTKVSWGELKLEMDFTRELASYTMTGGLPFFKLQSADASTLVSVSALAIDAKQKRLFDDDAYTYTGPVSVTLETVDVASLQGPSFVVEKLRFASDVVGQGEFLDLLGSYGVQKLKIGTETVGPSQIDIGFRHVNARALSEVNKEYMKLLQSGKLFTAGATPDMGMFKSMAKPLQTILEGSPEFAIDKLEIGLAQGKVAGQVVVRLPSAKVGDLAAAAENPLVLMGLASAMELEGKLSIPEVLLLAAGEDKAAMVPGLVGEGYVVQENGSLSTNFKYATGQMTVNGKKVDMGQMAAGGQRQQ